MKKLSIMVLGIVILNLVCSSAFTEDEKNTIAVVKQNKKSVVFVTNIQIVRDMFFSTQKVARGTGSGFVWDEHGHIVTNAHVIDNGDDFAITCPDQKTYHAKLVGKEEQKDIVKIVLKRSHKQGTQM